MSTTYAFMFGIRYEWVSGVGITEQTEQFMQCRSNTNEFISAVRKLIATYLIAGGNVSLRKVVMMNRVRPPTLIWIVGIVHRSRKNVPSTASVHSSYSSGNAANAAATNFGGYEEEEDDESNIF